MGAKGSRWFVVCRKRLGKHTLCLTGTAKRICRQQHLSHYAINNFIRARGLQLSIGDTIPACTGVSNMRQQIHNAIKDLFDGKPAATINTPRFTHTPQEIRAETYA